MTSPPWSVSEQDASSLLTGLASGTVQAIITSPPYSGLPGRGNTLDLVKGLLSKASDVLADEGTLTMIVGAGPDNLLLPFQVAMMVDHASRHDLEIQGVYVWDRTGQLNRDCGTQVVTNDYVLVAGRAGRVHQQLVPSSVIRTHQQGFNYGVGVTTPPDLAATLVSRLAEPSELIVDPFCGFSEIGVQAVHQGRRFVGSDLDPVCIAVSSRRLSTTPPSPVVA